jgi:hypothetical protein
MKRSFYEEAWDHPEIAIHLEETSSHRFRHLADIEPFGFILHWKFDQGMIENITGSIKYCVFPLTDKNRIRHIVERLRRKNYHLYCINDARVYVNEYQTRSFETLLSYHLPHHRATRVTRETVKLHVPVKLAENQTV